MNMLFLWLATFLVLKQTRTDAIIFHNFKVMKGYVIRGGTRLSPFQRAGLSAVMCASRCKADCGMVMYNRVRKTCETYRDRFQDISTTQNSEWTIIYKADLVIYGNWTMVFRAQSNSKQRVIDYWSDDRNIDDNPVDTTFPVKCLQLTKINECNRIFRSKVLSHWGNIDVVRFSLYTNGMEVRNIYFDGKSTTRDTWFEQKRIFNSSWENLRNEKTLQFFTLQGFTDNKCRRSFYIYGGHNGCSTDKGYNLIIEKTGDACADTWPIDNREFPIFIYSQTNEMAVITTGKFGQAEVMAVFVTFKT